MLIFSSQKNYLKIGRAQLKIAKILFNESRKTSIRLFAINRKLFASKSRPNLK